MIIIKRKRGRPPANQLVNNKLITEKTKELFIKAFNEDGAIIASACKKLGVARNTFLKYYNEDLQFQQAIDQARENAVDTVESCLYNKILSGDTTCIIFYLKCKGKWVDRQEINMNIEQVRIRYVLPDQLNSTNLNVEIADNNDVILKIPNQNV